VRRLRSSTNLEYESQTRRSRAPLGPSMETSATKQVLEKSVSPAALSTPERHIPRGSSIVASAAEKKPVGYGMPCSRCHAYYPADMHVCPICKSPERVSPTEPAVHPTAAFAAQPAAGAQIDAERERLLKELKSQAFASHTQINATATFRCVLEHQHSGATEPAAVCHSCYSDVRHRADIMEAALHIDAKDAAKIVYDAVWADTSDPNATYLNAAKALLSELHKRAGIGLLLGEHQRLAH